MAAGAFPRLWGAERDPTCSAAQLAQNHLQPLPRALQGPHARWPLLPGLSLHPPPCTSPRRGQAPFHSPAPQPSQSREGWPLPVASGTTFQVVPFPEVSHSLRATREGPTPQTRGLPEAGCQMGPTELVLAPKDHQAAPPELPSSGVWEPSPPGHRAPRDRQPGPGPWTAGCAALCKCTPASRACLALPPSPSLNGGCSSQQTRRWAKPVRTPPHSVNTCPPSSPLPMDRDGVCGAR